MLKQKIFYNAFIRYILQSTLKIQIGAYTTISLASWSTPLDKTQSIIAISTLVIFSAWPFVFAIVLYRNYNYLGYRGIQNKISSMYDGVLLRNDYWYSLTISIVFLLRRSLFVFITFVFYDYPGIQIQLFIYSSILYTVYLGYSKIYNDSAILILEYINEGIFMVISYHLVLFGNLLDSPFTSEVIGISMIFYIILMVAISTSLMVITNLKSIKKKLELRKFKKKLNLNVNAEETKS